MRAFLILMAAAAWPLLSGSPALAQVGMVTGAPASLGVTSPLGIGPGAPVGATGIPLGATELATPGISPNAAGTAALGSMTASSACSGIGASAQPTASDPTGSSTMTGTPAPTPLFDAAGISGTASGTCASGTVTASSSPTASASSPAGIGPRSSDSRVGIPMGSTELSTGGLSPLPDITLQSQLPVDSTATSSAPCTPTGASSTTATSMSSASC
jgi:hypothetical protein